MTTPPPGTLEALRKTLEEHADHEEARWKETKDAFYIVAESAYRHAARLTRETAIDRDRATEEVTPLEHAAREVASAVQNEGTTPNYHRQQLRRLQREWPTLYYALRDLERVTPTP